MAYELYLNVGTKEMRHYLIKTLNCAKSEIYSGTLQSPVPFSISYNGIKTPETIR